ncbi:MAG: hypothetical protein IJ026_07035 [Candidatus Methanomethylophilaceae archaeon]|nr:hypothetical protein [Candidatus Methanomethylophilaceae archaeon]
MNIDEMMATIEGDPDLRAIVLSMLEGCQTEEEIRSKMDNPDRFAECMSILMGFGVVGDPGF